MSSFPVKAAYQLIYLTSCYAASNRWAVNCSIRYEHIAQSGKGQIHMSTTQTRTSPVAVSNQTAQAASQTNDFSNILKGVETRTKSAKNIAKAKKTYDDLRVKKDHFTAGKAAIDAAFMGLTPSPEKTKKAYEIAGLTTKDRVTSAASSVRMRLPRKTRPTDTVKTEKIKTTNTSTTRKDKFLKVLAVVAAFLLGAGIGWIVGTGLFSLYELIAVNNRAWNSDSWDIRPLIPTFHALFVVSIILVFGFTAGAIATRLLGADRTVKTKKTRKTRSEESSFES
jgi:hypothetical protein